MNIYGPTEATINTTLYQCKEEEENPVIPIGKPLFNYNVWIVDKHLNMLPIGVPGELCISGEGLARGYLNNPGLTHESCPAHPFIPGERLYRTGDFANWLPDGNLEFHGRIDQQVKIRGQRVEPEEIEIQLLSHPTVKEAAVLAKEDKRKRNYYLSAYMVSNGELNMPGIIKHLATHLPDYMIPGQFIELEQMPLTPNGKIDRKKLLKLDKGKEINVEYVAPRNESEEILAELWKSELELEKVGIKNNYFNIGGDSITSIKLVNLINEKFAAAIEVADLYSYNTVEKLADKIAADKMNFNDGSLKQDDERRIEAIASLPFLKEESQDVYPMSDIQKGMVFDFMKDTKNSFYHVQLIFRIKYKEFDALQLKKAFSLLVKKHSILRTHFNLYDYSEPVQIVHKEMPPDVEHLDITHLEKPGQEDLIYRFLREDREKSFNIGEAAPLWRVRTFALDKENIFFIWIGHHAIIDGWGFSSLLTELNHIYFKLASTTSFVPASLKNTYKEFVIEQIVESKNSDTINYWKKELAGYKRFDFSTMVKNSDSRKGKKVYTENLGTRLLEKLEKTAKKYDTSVKHLCFGAYAYMLSTIACQDDIVVGLLTNSRPQCEDGDKIIGCFLNTVPVRMKIPRNTVWLDYLDAVEKKMRQLKKFDKISLYMIARGTGEKVQDKNPLFDTVFNYTDFHIYNKAHWEMMQIKAADNDDDPFSLEGAINTNPLFNFYIDVTGGNFHITVYFANTLIDPELAGNLFTCFRRILEKMADKPASMMEKTELITVTEKYLYDFQAKAASKKAWEKYLEFYEEPASIPGKIAAIEGTGNVGEKIDRKHVATALEREETTGLNRLALQERVALSTILKTTWGVLLSKYNGRRDVVFDTIVPCPYPGQKTVVIPVRIRYGKETTFNELLQKVERETLELTKILPVSVLKRNLIDHILVAKKNPNPGPVEVTRHEYDFHIILSWGDRVTAAVKYNANVYKREVIERITADYGRLLKFFSEDINTRITGLRLESRVSILKKANINFEFNI
jgi:non-ribosomal peptide synthetase component F/acyl carrier protein